MRVVRVVVQPRDGACRTEEDLGEGAVEALPRTGAGLEGDPAWSCWNWTALSCGTKHFIPKQERPEPRFFFYAGNVE